MGIALLAEVARWSALGPILAPTPATPEGCLLPLLSPRSELVCSANSVAEAGAGRAEEEGCISLDRRRSRESRLWGMKASWTAADVDEDEGGSPKSFLLTRSALMGVWLNFTSAG